LPELGPVPIRRLIWRTLLCMAALPPAAGLLSTAAVAQELAPRAYWPTPNGIRVAVLSYQSTTGDIVIDPSLPLTGVDSNINVFQASFQQSFSLFGRSANLQLQLPYATGQTEGLVEGEFRTRDTTGFTDSRVRLAINLKGAPAMDAAGFQTLRKAPRTIIGASLLVQLPTGEYEADKLINLGTNRWAAKPEIGVIWPMRPTWLLEFDVGVWLFGDNDNFLGQTREQEPILSTEVHLIKRIRPGFWVSIDANYYVGGSTVVNGTERSDLQRNSRLGATVVVPISGRHALRGSFNGGIATASGGDFNSMSLSYIYAW
jgi:hypothetical protein